LKSHSATKIEAATIRGENHAAQDAHPLREDTRRIIDPFSSLLVRRRHGGDLTSVFSTQALSPGSRESAVPVRARSVFD
jgi:hypothetical protein